MDLRAATLKFRKALASLKAKLLPKNYIVASSQNSSVMYVCEASKIFQEARTVYITSIFLGGDTFGLVKVLKLRNTVLSTKRYAENILLTSLLLLTIPIYFILLH